MSVKEKQFTVYEYAEYSDRPAEWWTRKIEPSMIKNLSAEINTAIATNDSSGLKKLLTDDFIYPGDGKTKQDVDPQYSPYHGNYKGGHHEKIWNYEFYLARPIIEALFFEH